MFHVGSHSDLVGKQAFEPFRPSIGIISQQVLSVPDSDLVLSLRRLVYKTLADDLATYDAQGLTDLRLKKRMDVLESVLVGLESLHAQKRIHGDLRPENVTIGKDGSPGLVDYLMRPPVTRMSEEQLAYIAPEALFDRPQSASDVFAFGKLAQRLLGSYLWDSRRLPNRLNSDAFEWVLDYCTLQDPRERPDIATLREVLFGAESGLVLARARRSLRQGAQRALDHLDNVSSQPRGELSEPVNSAANQIHDLIDRFPETVLAISVARKSARLVETIAIDSGLILPHNQGQEARQARNSNTDLKHLREPNEKIDLPLKDRLHRLHFGSGIALDHNEQMPHVRKGSRLARKRVAYLEHIGRLEEARMNLLSKDIYLYTSGVAELLSQGPGEVVDADVATLRRWKHLLAISDHGRWLYPLFQFEQGTPSVSPLIQEANDRFRDSEPWEVLSWWFLPRISLQGESLASVVHTIDGREATLNALNRLSTR